MSDPKATLDHADDPRPLSDHKTREEHSAEEIRKWREDAQNQHDRWMDVMKNRYGKE